MQFLFGVCKIGLMGLVFSILKSELIPCGLVYPQMGTSFLSATLNSV